MKTVSVGELRQNPTRMLGEVESGETYSITRHGHEIGRIVPPRSQGAITPPRAATGARTRELPRVEVTTAASLDELLADEKGEW